MGEIIGVIGVHVHNDGDLAIANSIAAVQGGATQIHGTINGYGERCGNANLCSVIPNLQIKFQTSLIFRTFIKILCYEFE